MRAVAVFALGLVTLSSLAHADDAGRAGPIEPAAAMPPGHPAVRPPPATPSDPNEAASGASGGGTEAPEDSVTAAPTAPAGSIEVRVADPQGKPVANTEVTLGILYNSVAKGDSRKRLTKTSDNAGVATFTGLDTGSGVAYRPMVLRDGATFSSTPFGLGAQGGMRVLLHTFPVTDDVEKALIVSQSIVYAEVKDDRVQVQQVLRFYNVGRSAWVPRDVVIRLPETFTAFAAQQGMTDVGADAVAGQGIKLRGTFGPGEHAVEFKWQVPYSGLSAVNMEIGMPPHMAAAQVIVPASKGIAMSVEGFDGTKTSSDGAGQRVLTAQKQIRREEPPVKSINVSISGLPTDGPGRGIATLLAFGGVVLGLVMGSRKPPPKDPRRERERLLQALSAVERAHAEGAIGPKTYERERRERIDDLARTFATEPDARCTPPKKRRR